MSHTLDDSLKKKARTAPKTSRPHALRFVVCISEQLLPFQVPLLQNLEVTIAKVALHSTMQAAGCEKSTCACVIYRGAAPLSSRFLAGDKPSLRT